jgi:microcystin-dependent protein
MAPKTEFKADGTIVTSAFMQSIYGTGADGGHRHDGIDADGHCARITMSELAQEILTHIDQKVADKYLGEVRAYAGTNIPDDFLPCDGRDVTQGKEYSAFRDWLSANRSDLIRDGKFYLPDYRGRTLIGAGGANEQDGGKPFVLGDSDGEQMHLLTTLEMPSHNHSIRDGGGGNGYSATNKQDRNDDSSWVLHTNSKGGDKPHNNMQPYAVVNYIIRVKGATEQRGVCTCNCEFCQSLANG